MIDGWQTTALRLLILGALVCRFHLQVLFGFCIFFHKRAHSFLIFAFFSTRELIEIRNCKHEFIAFSCVIRQDAISTLYTCLMFSLSLYYELVRDFRWLSEEFRQWPHFRDIIRSQEIYFLKIFFLINYIWNTWLNKKNYMLFHTGKQILFIQIYMAYLPVALSSVWESKTHWEDTTGILMCFLSSLEQRRRLSSVQTVASGSWVVP